MSVKDWNKTILQDCFDYLAEYQQGKQITERIKMKIAGKLNTLLRMYHKPTKKSTETEIKAFEMVQCVTGINKCLLNNTGLIFTISLVVDLLEEILTLLNEND